MRVRKAARMSAMRGAGAVGVILALASFLLFSFVLSLPSSAQDSGQTSGQTSAIYPDGRVPPLAVPGNLVDRWTSPPTDLRELKKRPLLYWRYHAMQPQKPIRNSIFVLFFCFAFNLILKKRAAIAAESIKRRFWKTLGAGVLCMFLFVTTTRLCYEVELFEPLGNLSMALLQLLCLFGLAVSTRLMGQSILKKFNICQPEAGKDPTVAQILVWTFVGIAVIASFSFIPRIPLPNGHFVAPLVPRIALLFCTLGMGALIRTKLGRKEAV